MEEVRVITDPAVGNQYKAGKTHVVNRFFHGRAERQMIQRIARKGFNSDRNSVIIHEQAHLDNGLVPLFLGNAELPLTLF